MIPSNLIANGCADNWGRLQFATAFLPAGQPQSGSPSPFEQPTHEKAGNKRRVLVVDDVFDVIDMLSVLLTHAGYEVATASSAREAIDLIQENQFDIIISDIGMPEMNGYQLAEAVRSLPGYERVPMVAVTGYSMFDDRARSLTAGFTEHLTKPIDPRAFLKLIEQL
jgi:CheY-like chemotaxis protein